MRIESCLLAALSPALALAMGCGDSDVGSETDSGVRNDFGADAALAATGGISGVSLFQVIEVPLLDGSGALLPVDAREVPIVANRGARAVVYLREPAGESSSTVEVRVEVLQGGEITTYRSELVLEGDSIAGDPSTAAQIDLPAAAIQTDSRFSISAWLEGEDAPYARIPETGDVQLGAEETGAIKIHLVPYEVDGFTPDTSPEIIDGFRDAVLSLYPVSEVVITVGAERPFGTNDVGEVLIDVGVVQELDDPPPDVYYYGMVSGVADRESFAGSTGTSESGGDSPDRAYFAAGAAFGDVLSESTLTHELGHLHQLEHAPCGSPPNVDPMFPDPSGTTGAMGFDFRTNEFIADDTADLMGYCQPRWIGAYHYSKLVEHVRLSQTW